MGHAFMSTSKIISPLRLRTDLHITRKIWHVSTGIFGLLIYKKIAVPPDTAATVLLAFAVLAFAFELLRLNNEQIGRASCRERV